MGRPTRKAAVAAVARADRQLAAQKAAGLVFREEKDTRPEWSSAAYKAAIESVLLHGEFANKFIRVGEEYQAVVPRFDGEAVADGSDRGDELVQVEYAPLTEPPQAEPILSLKDVIAARKAAEAAATEAQAEEEPEDFDEEGEPLLPRGVGAVGDFCLATVSQAGEPRRFKGVLLNVRRFSPHLLVKMVGDENGAPFSVISAPDCPKSYLNCREVTAWVPPEQRPGYGEGGASTDSGRRFRERQLKPTVDVLEETGGMRLHLDPRRVIDGYEGTGYLGVHHDGWHTGYKSERPYTVSFDGAYAGRFATVEQAAVQFARLEAGMPPLVIDSSQLPSRQSSVPSRQSSSTG